MSQEVTDLQAAVATLKTEVAAVKAVADDLKSKLEAAVADNAAKAKQITDLQTQLTAAQAAALSPADEAAIQQATADIKTADQTLSDTAAADAAAN